jgi:hypothetical protein
MKRRPAMTNHISRRSFIGGSDARIIMGNNEAALVRLWQQKRGELEPEDLSGNLIVQLGLVTEALNRHWYERNTGQTVECVQHRLRHPALRLTQTGYTVGVGGEYAFLNWLTGFVEYDYYNFGNSNSSSLVCTAVVCGIATTSVGVKTDINVVKAGLNLKLGPF